MDKYVDGGALLQVLIASILGGAGLVAMFAVGLVGTSIAGTKDRARADGQPA